MSPVFYVIFIYVLIWSLLCLAYLQKLLLTFDIFQFVTVVVIIIIIITDIMTDFAIITIIVVS